MDFNTYQANAAKYRTKNTPNEERVLGILEEAGEVAGVFKKFLRGDYGETEASARLLKELGDVLWYVSQVARDNGWDFSIVAEANLEKLEDRWLRNQLKGDGDNR